MRELKHNMKATEANSNIALKQNPIPVIVEFTLASRWCFSLPPEYAGSERERTILYYSTSGILLWPYGELPRRLPPG